MKRWTLVAASTFVVAVAGCTADLQGTGVLDNAWHGDRTLIAGHGFQHLLYRRGSSDQSGPVHVYLEGDGLPWATRTRVSKDPSPRNRLALQLMARDPAPSLYLGRPCYHGLARSSGCSPWLWTHGRYGEEVVRSMSASVRGALGPDNDRALTLIGYSGGGVLAMLIAARVEQVREVVTIAANLDVDAWADHHGYSRLRGSLNPATQPPLPSRIRQIHLAGGRDLRVPARLSRSVADGQSHAQFLIFPQFDHRCCWERAWPAILAALDDSDLDPVSLQFPSTIQSP